MKTKLSHVWDSLKISFWFVPAVMVAAAFLLAIGLLWVDRHTGVPAAASWAYTGGADGARSLLSTVAGSTITVAGVVFSITISTLTQASSQFGPRLLRNFMRDTGNQVVLGTFVATFLYCLMILRDVRAADGGAGAFVPNWSITGAVVLAVGSIVVLIYFIDHVSRSLQGPVLVARIGQELARAVETVYPRDMGTDAATPAGPPPPPPDAAAPVMADESGYLQAVDQDGLVATARAHGLLVRLCRRPGDFVVAGSPLLMVDASAADRPVADAVAAALRGKFILGKQRTAEQDIEYSFRQLVEIAVRALSPGINDPFTAVNCVDWLSVGLAAVATHPLPDPCRRDVDGAPRVIARVSTFERLADVALSQIREYAGDSVAVTVRLLEALATVGRQCGTSATHRAVLRGHAEQVYQGSRVKLSDAGDLADVSDGYRVAVAALSP